MQQKQHIHIIQQLIKHYMNIQKRSEEGTRSLWVERKRMNEKIVIFVEESGLFISLKVYLLKVARKLIGPFPVTAAWMPKMRKTTMARRACLISAN